MPLPVYLGLNDCNFEGPLPSEMGRLWNMTRMQIQNNWFEGTLPHTFGNMQRLDLFTMEGNLLSGEIPPEVCELRPPANLGEDETYPGVLRQFVVDCYNPRTKLGFDCDIPSCCTLCRDTRG